MSGKALIIGYGNTLRGDDGIGQAAARALANEVAFGRCEVVVCHQLTPELAESIAAVDLVVFLDAAVSVPPGIVAISRIQGASAPSPSLVHTADPAALLALAGKLYGRSPVAFLVAIGICSMELSEDLSEAAAAAVPEAVAAIHRLLSEHLGEGLIGNIA